MTQIVAPASASSGLPPEISENTPVDIISANVDGDPAPWALLAGFFVTGDVISASKR